LTAEHEAPEQIHSLVPSHGRQTVPSVSIVGHIWVHEADFELLHVSCRHTGVVHVQLTAGAVSPHTGP
jgi:hypothetical protein